MAAKLLTVQFNEKTIMFTALSYKKKKKKSNSRKHFLLEVQLWDKMQISLHLGDLFGGKIAGACCTGMIKQLVLSKCEAHKLYKQGKEVIPRPNIFLNKLVFTR